jgi:hypothetical protein
MGGHHMLNSLRGYVRRYTYAAGHRRAAAVWA